MGLRITKDELAELETEVYDGKIHVIDRADQVSDAVGKLSTADALGFDTETKPSFKKGKTNKVALLQLATEDECYLFRLNKIGYPKELEELMCDDNIKKIGLSLRDDFSALSKRTGNRPQNFVDLQQFVDGYGIEDNSLQKIYAIVFNKKISKRQRLSNWEAEELDAAQQSYAAIDAWACLRIYNHLTKGDKDE
ncbi:MAG: 3'-5' exonuclease [Fermentimonas sp.]